MNNEPVITATTIGAIVAALLNLLLVFGVNITDAQVQGILQFVAVVVPVALAAWYARGRVTPTDRR